MANKIEKDPFHNDQPQIADCYQYSKPPDLPDFDESKGGKTVKRILTDEGFTADFIPPEIPDLNFSRKRRK